MENVVCSVCFTSYDVMKRCTRCHNSIYCSRSCQISDWPKHKLKCEKQITGNKTEEMVENLNNSLPSTEIGQASYRIKVLSNHTKVYINFFENETYGHKLMDKFASYLAIPLSELKLIAKGKTVNKDNVWDLIFMDKCKIFQAIGEKNECSKGLDDEDIKEIMEKLYVSRNTAIKSLRSAKGDVIDAILALGNK